MVAVHEVYRDARPYARWWWFSGAIREEDVRHQVSWLARNGFGGVEIAWIYPLPGAAPGPRWLSPAWSSCVASAARTARAEGLGCDFTFGTLWPFGGSFVSEADASKTFDGPSAQRLHRSWEAPHAPPGRVLDHLSRPALTRYARVVGDALAPALAEGPAALFCDSFEVEVEGLWGEGLDEAFRARFGYDVRPLAATLDARPDVRYDYRALLSDALLERFFGPFTELCRARGAVSRVQCHGAPTDLLAAYAAADVPESEALLFDPHFSSFAASAAALAGKPLVSCETFTCLYGWKPHPGPPPGLGEEQVADCKLLADALFAHGVNFVLWHGMPYNPPGGENAFYATVHVGESGALAPHVAPFNAYLAEVSSWMRRGRPLCGAAVYLPLEDRRMEDRLPGALRRPSALYAWELQHQRFPAETLPRRPAWITAPFLETAQVVDGELRAGALRAPFLYVDAAWMDARALAAILRLARRGLPVCLRRKPLEPGARKSPSFDRDLERLLSLDTVRDTLDRAAPGPPLLEGPDLPEFQCREDEDGLTLFFAHPLSRGVSYPMSPGQSRSEAGQRREAVLRWGGLERPLSLPFAPNRSLLLRVGRDGAVEDRTPGYTPPPPADPRREDP